MNALTQSQREKLKAIFNARHGVPEPIVKTVPVKDESGDTMDLGQLLNSGFVAKPTKFVDSELEYRGLKIIMRTFATGAVRYFYREHGFINPVGGFLKRKFLYQKVEPFLRGKLWTHVPNQRAIGGLSAKHRLVFLSWHNPLKADWFSLRVRRTVQDQVWLVV